MDAIGIDSAVFHNSSRMTSEVYKHSISSDQTECENQKTTEKRQELTNVEN